MASIYDISNKVGVSIATVSRVLNGSEKVSEKTRKKVEMAIAELDYKPNVFARGLGSGSIATVGIMCTDASDMFLSTGLYHVEYQLREHGYSSLLTSTGTKLENKQRALSNMLEKKVDGLILVGSSFVEEQDIDNEYIREAAKKIPIVLINGLINSENIYSLSCNDFENIFRVTDTLISSGRKKAIFLYTSYSHSCRLKIQGFKAALGVHGIRFEEGGLIQLSRDVIAAQDKLKNIYDRDFHFDAVIAAEDICAVAAIKMATEKRINIPRDMEVVGYNNSLVSQCTVPELSTVDNHIKIMSERAVSLLLSVIAGEKVETRQIVASDFVKRGSTRFDCI